MKKRQIGVWTMLVAGGCLAAIGFAGENFTKPYDGPRTERENVFEFAQKPTVKYLGEDRYEIAFAVKGFCDVNVALVDAEGKTVRCLASGVLGPNAPAPFQKNVKTQKIIWDGKDELEHYVREPGKLRVRVGLGLKPTFDKILGWHEYDSATWDVMDIYRGYRALDIDESGVYVLVGRQTNIRQYDRDGKYVRTLLPPPADLPVDKLIGMTRLEIEPGVFSPHAPAGENASPSTISGIPHFFNPGFGLAQHPRIFDGHLVWLTTGYNSPVSVHRFDLKSGAYADADRVWAIPSQSAAQDLKFQRVGYPKSAFSPDGRFLYISGMYDGWYGPSSFAVHRLDAQRADSKTIFVGEVKKPGSDNAHFQRPEGIDVDEQGRVYVCDFTSNRIQVFGSDAKFLRTIKIPQPYLVRVDRRRGGIYVLHVDRSARAQQWMLTRLKSVDDPTPAAQTAISNDMSVYGKKNNELLMAVDSWAEKPRVWVTPNSFNVQMYEDREKSFVKLLDFHEAVKQAGLTPHMMNAGNDHSIIASKVSADATTEQLYYHGMARDAIRYDLADGKHALRRMPSGDFYADRGFDARGFLYTHVDGSVTRHDPRVNFVEVPFDYGTLGTDSSRELYVGNCQGVLPLKDQAAGKGFCNGMGVNARGDVAVASPIFYVPKFDDKDLETIALGDDTGGGFSNLVSHRKTAYAAWQGEVAKALQRGEKVYSVKPAPGRVLAGDTIWTFDWTGELRGEDVIPGMRLVAGIQIDADGSLYTMFDKPRLVGGKPFLTGRLSAVGADKPLPGAPVTGTFMKTPPSGAKVLTREAPMPMSPWPQRPEDVVGGWVDGAEWLYAGVGPVGGSPKSSSRHCTDWYGRSFVPENYRHSVGVLDVNGNLIMHVGRYGNADSGGPNAKIKIGGDEIAFTNVFGLTATDKYLCVSDLGSDRIVVLRLNYHVEEFVSVK